MSVVATLMVFIACQVFSNVVWMTFIPFSHCAELDPCFSNPCQANSECVPTPDESDYNCTCLEPSFYGNGTFCTNPCKPNPCSNYESCNGTFDNETVGHVCYCDSNRFYNDTDGKCTCQYFCQFTDEDYDDDDDDDDGDYDDNLFDPLKPVCTERCTHASYSCSNGYWLDSKETCKEIDLCHPTKPCGPHGILCSVSSNAYNCTCRHGYTFNGTTCIDVDECETNSSNICGAPDVQCVNTDGGYLCVCDVLNSIAVKDHNGHLHCLQINECGVNNAGCSQNCLDTDNGRQCSCIDGFHLNADNRSCAFDEGGSKYKPCTGDSVLQCNVGGVCVVPSDRNESRCVCFSGYKLNQTSNSCEPVGNCDLIKNNCFNGGNCTPSAFQPGYFCSCPNGYRNGPLGRCYEYDVCLQEPNICGENGYCVKVVGGGGGGGYKCKCHSGYVLVEGTSSSTSKCTAIDYCSRSAVKQSCEVEGKVCRNVPGHYECYCPIPYYPRGSDGDTACIPPGNDAFIVVMDMFLLGSYFDPSYIGQRRMEMKLKSHLFGSILFDVDIKNIELTAFDVSGAGAHIKAYVFFGNQVPYLNELLLETCANNTIGDGGSCILPPDLVVDRTALAHSISPYAMCYAESRLCGPLGKCIQGEHNYTCQCKIGYEVDGYVDPKKPICVDVDECNINPHICGSPSMRCVNIVGDFECECEECYYSNEDVTACIHVCAINPCKNDGRCSENRIGHNCGYSCRCSRDHYGPHCEFFNDELRSANTNTAITGGVLGGILLLLLLIGGLVLFRNKKKGGYFEFRK